MNILTQISPSAPTDMMSALSTYGLAGILLAYHMWWQVFVGRRQEAATNRMARANALLVISLRQAHDEAKHQAREIIAEIDQAERRGE